MKPIEEGCRAVIVGSLAGNNGIEVTIGKFLGYIKGWDDRWETDKILNGTRNDKNNSIRESQVRRIDNYDGNTKVEWSELWQPLKEFS